jgi:cytochrome c-type biogenesis protein CcmH/NrfG
MAQSAAVQRERRERDNPAANDAPRDLVEHFKEFAQQNPSTCAMWCFFAGFVIGWKLKPW